MVVKHFPAGLGQTMQKVKTGALNSRPVLPSHCAKGIMSELQGRSSDFQPDLEEDSSSLGLCCTPSHLICQATKVSHIVAVGCKLFMFPTALNLPQTIVLVEPEHTLP